jgi:putative sterol carrier protein
VGGYEVFSATWARAWRDALNASEAYKRAAASWEGAVALVMHPDAASGVTAPRAVWLDLWHGSCREARLATEADVASAAFVIEAQASVWRELLHGKSSPITALMLGRLRLTRGSLSALLPFAGAANELVGTAIAIHSVFPGEAA